MNDPFLINDNYSFSPSISVKILVTALATGILILTIHSSEITSFPSGVQLGEVFLKIIVQSDFVTDICARFV